jgi:tRNA(Ile)-lysidine synthase
MELDKTPEQDWSSPWLKHVHRRVRRWCAAGVGTSWVVAVSGGSDSVGLLRALYRLAPELGLSLSVAHLDHGVRGEAARADALFVQELAASLGLPFDLGHWQPARTGHFEADARKARYSWLQEAACARGASVVAVGHTLDDQAETILHRIVRGTSLHGLSGMPSRRQLGTEPAITLVRPLLSVSRSSIREGLAALGQAHRDDLSNADLSRTRARIRHDLLPRLACEYNSRVAEALVRLGKLSAAAKRTMEDHLLELGHSVIRSVSHDRAELRRDCLHQLPLFLRVEVLRRVWKQAGWPEASMSARRWHRLASLAGNQELSHLPLGGGIELTTTGACGQPPHGFVLNRAGASKPLPCRPPETAVLPLEVPGSVPWEGARIEAVLDPELLRDETIDLDRVIQPLRVRAPVPGDRFEPLGMGGKSTPLSDFFRSRKVSRDERARIALLCDEIGIVWVVGHRIAERVKVTEQTRRAMGLRKEPAQKSAECGTQNVE